MKIKSRKSDRLLPPLDRLTTLCRTEFNVRIMDKFNKTDQTMQLNRAVEQLKWIDFCFG